MNFKLEIIISFLMVLIIVTIPNYVFGGAVHYEGNEKDYATQVVANSGHGVPNYIVQGADIQIEVLTTWHGNEVDEASFKLETSEIGRNKTKKNNSIPGVERPDDDSTFNMNGSYVTDEYCVWSIEKIREIKESEQNRVYPGKSYTLTVKTKPGDCHQNERIRWFIGDRQIGSGVEVSWTPDKKKLDIGKKPLRVELRDRNDVKQAELNKQVKVGGLLIKKPNEDFGDFLVKTRENGSLVGTENLDIKLKYLGKDGVEAEIKAKTNPPGGSGQETSKSMGLSAEGSNEGKVTLKASRATDGRGAEPIGTKLTVKTPENGKQPELSHQVEIKQNKGSPNYAVIRQEYEDAEQESGKYASTDPDQIGSGFTTSGGDINHAGGDDQFGAEDYDHYIVDGRIPDGLTDARDWARDQKVCTVNGKLKSFKYCESPSKKFYNVLSNFRAPAHNTSSEVGGAGTSNHQHGKAVDLVGNFQKWRLLYPNKASTKEEALELLMRKQAGATGDSYSKSAQNKVHAGWP